MEERRLPRVSDRDDHMHARPRDLVISPDRHDPFAGKHTLGQSRYSTFIHDLSLVMFECRSLSVSLYICLWLHCSPHWLCHVTSRVFSIYRECAKNASSVCYVSIDIVMRSGIRCEFRRVSVTDSVSSAGRRLFVAEMNAVSRWLLVYNRGMRDCGILSALGYQVDVVNAISRSLNVCCRVRVVLFLAVVCEGRRM